MRDGRRRAVAFSAFRRDRRPAMTRATRRAVVVTCLALLGGTAYWYGGPLHPTQQPQPKQQNLAGPRFRRGGGNPNDSVPVLAVAAQLADVPEIGRASCRGRGRVGGCGVER